MTFESDAAFRRHRMTPPQRVERAFRRTGLKLDKPGAKLSLLTPATRRQSERLTIPTSVSLLQAISPEPPIPGSSPAQPPHHIRVYKKKSPLAF